MWQQARARLRNTDARLCVLVDCPSAGAWAQSLLAVPAAAAFASGIAVQASCRAGEMAWSQDIGGEAGGGSPLPQAAKLPGRGSIRGAIVPRG